MGLATIWCRNEQAKSTTMFLLHAVNVYKGTISLSSDTRASPILDPNLFYITLYNILSFVPTVTSEVRLMTINNDGNALTVEGI